MLKHLIKAVKYIFQAIIVYVLYTILRILPLRLSSYIGGKLGIIAGYILISRNKLALNNVKYVFPNKSIKERKKIVKDMWENLGRVIGEYPHSKEFIKNYDKYIELEGLEHLEEAKAKDKGGIFVSAHYGNWELSGIIIAKNDIKVNVLYREPNNYLLLPLFKMREKMVGEGKAIKKSSRTVKELLLALKRKEYIAILVDQKTRTGTLTTFLDKQTQMIDSGGLLSLKTGSPIIPSLIRREKGCKFKVTVYPIIEADKTKPIQEESVRITQEIKEILEEEIRAYPSQWLWIHDRWDIRKKGIEV